MKRLIALLGIVLLALGIRFYDAGLLRITNGEGVLTVFAATEYTPDLFLPTGEDCYRLDLVGAENVDKLLSGAFARVQLVEMDGKLIYAYSPRIPRSEWVHGKRVNLMIYVNQDKVTAGVPIIKGSY